MKFQIHPFHLVDPSPWPLMTSISLLILTFGAVLKFQGYSTYLWYIGLISLLFILTLWWKDVIIESTYLGHHTSNVEKGIKIGFLLFVISEIFFFISIFWAFFHSSLSPTVELASFWPPIGIETLNPFELPLLNTIILLTSGSTVTWAHHSIIAGNRKSLLISLFITILLAFIFTFFQAYEYYYAPFTFADGIYGSTFFFSTGFHGIHVIIGAIFLLINFFRILFYHLTDTHHNGFESAIIYWHFVDIVWLFLFISVYWWGS